MGYVLMGLWAIWFVVWWGLARYSAQSRPETYVSVLPALAGLAICDLLLIVPPFVVTNSGTGWGIAVAGIGLALAIWSRVCLGRSWAGSLTIQQGHRLVRSGAYRFIRHPIYAALILAYTGSAVFIGGVALIAPWFALAAFLYKIRIEERQLEAEFPEYGAYQRSTGALIPRKLRWRHRLPH